MYLIHEASKLHDDIRIKRIAVDKMKSYVHMNPKSTIEDCQVIIQAVEHIFLVRIKNCRLT